MRKIQKERKRESILLCKYLKKKKNFKELYVTSTQLRYIYIYRIN